MQTDQPQKLTKETIVLLTIRHSKDLPEKATDIVAQRTYSFLYSQGCEAGVTARLLEVKKDV